MRKARALHKRYGRRGHAMGPQAITRPVSGGLVDVVIVDAKGRVLRTVARGISRSRATRYIAEGA